MAVAFRTKAEQLWRRFDFNSPSRIDRGIELFMSTHKELTQTKLWEPPRVLINTTLGPTLMAELTEIVKRHQVGKSVDRVSCVLICLNCRELLWRRWKTLPI